MPTIPVNAQGHYLFYVDTGPPQLEGILADYTTLIIVHGTAFHGGTFKDRFGHSLEYI